MPETAPTLDEDVEGVDEFPVIVAVDVGGMTTPDDTTFAVLRVRWSTAAEYEGGDNDNMSTFIVPTSTIVDLLIEDLTKVSPLITQDEIVPEDV